MSDPTTWQQIIELADKITATVVLIGVIYLFVSGKIIAKSAIEKTVIKTTDRLNNHE